MSRYRAWDKLEKKFIFFTEIEGLLSHCDKTYKKLNVAKPQLGLPLKDNAGKQMFEGDNILFTLNTGEKLKDVIEYKREGFRAKKHNFPLTFYWCIEIIGHIHENQESLNA